MREFYIFTSSVLDLWPLDLKVAPQLVTLVQRYATSFYKDFLFRKIGGTGRTDRRMGATRNVAH